MPLTAKQTTNSNVVFGLFHDHDITSHNLGNIQAAILSVVALLPVLLGCVCWFCKCPECCRKYTRAFGLDAGRIGLGEEGREGLKLIRSKWGGVVGWLIGWLVDRQVGWLVV